LDRARVETLLLGVFAVFAGAYAAVTGLAPHRGWALFAAGGYLVAALCRLWLPRVAMGALVVGAVLLPLAVQVKQGLANPEIQILRDAATHWVHTGTPYRLTASADPNAYNVYLPGLALFGMPSAVFGAGWATDPRIYLCAATLAGFLVLGKRSAALLVVCCPFLALQLVTGGTDPVVLAALCVGLVLAERSRVAGGMAIGFAVALKQFAWPALLLAGLVARKALPVTVSVLTALVVLGVPAAVDPRAFWENAVALPLGLLPVHLTAQSPLPGHLLAQHGFGPLAAILLAAAAAMILVAVLRNPPRTAVVAARWLALGLTVAILLGPSARFGYFAYPVVLLALPWFSRCAAQPWRRRTRSDR
jgi:hypothetical protein